MPAEMLEVPTVLTTPRWHGANSAVRWSLSVHGGRYDHVARVAAPWFKAAIDAMSADGARPQTILVRQVGFAPDKAARFFAEPLGCRTFADWMAATDAAIEAEAQKAIAASRALIAARIDRRGDIVVADRVIDGVVVAQVLADDGREYTVRAWNGNFMEQK